MRRLLHIFVYSVCLLQFPAFASIADSAGMRVEVSQTLIKSFHDSICHNALLVHFRFNCSLVESDYMDNLHALECFSALFSDSISALSVDTIIITSCASPEGNVQHNFRLARQRAVSVKEYLLWKYSYLSQARILIYSRGEDWTGLRQSVELDNDIPNRTEVLQILNEVPDTERCKVLLQHLNRGEAYRYIDAHLLPQLRNAAVCTVKRKDVKHKMMLSVGSLPYKTQHTISSLVPHEEKEFLDKFRIPDKKSFSPSFALKTNLLFDLALAPNIELELPFGKSNRWSLNVEWIFPWWLIDNDKFCFQLLSGSLEGRYWLGNRTIRHTLTGHFLGFYAGGGKYDLQWKEKGYQGEFYIASGISYGYAVPVASRLNLEFSIGIGLLRTDYKHYRAIDNYRTLLWQNSGNYTWFGPTKGKISLVWLLGRKQKGRMK